MPALLPQSKKPFTVQALLLEAEDGFAARADTVYLPGETLYLLLQIQGHAVDRSSRVRLSYRIEALDFNGVPFVEPELGKIETELAPQDARWVPRVRFSPALPPFADSGKYRFLIQVTDELAKTQARQEVGFQVRGRRVDASDALVIRNFAFSRQEDGEALPVSAYRQGDVLWAAFDLTGYKTGEKNLVSVEYTLVVVNGLSEVIFRQPEAAREQGTSFYPRRYVHAVFSLNLEKGIRPGAYTILLSARDSLGAQSSEGRFPFTVE